MNDATRKAACLALMLAVAGLAPAQTILIVTSETLDGQSAPRPYRSQEGFMSAMFDLGYISFDTGPYVPQVGWDSGVYDEPLAIATAGLADYLVLARIDSRLRTPVFDPGVPAPLPDIHSEVSFRLLAIPGDSLLGQGQFSLNSLPPREERPDAAEGPGGAQGPDGTAASAQAEQSSGPGSTTGPVSARVWRVYELWLLRVGEALARQCLPLLRESGASP